MLAFLSEGSKFLFFDVSICHAPLWYPGGDESMPQSARSCTLGRTGYFIIASTVVFFGALVMICLKAPKLRILKEDYGDTYQDNYMGNAQMVHSGSLADDPENQIPSANLGSMPDDEDGDTLQVANTSMVMSMSQDDSTLDFNQPQDPPSSSYVQYSGSDPSQGDLAEGSSSFPVHRMVSEDSDVNMIFEDNFMNMSESGVKAGIRTRGRSKDPPASADLRTSAAKLAYEPNDQLNSLAAKVAASPQQNKSNTVDESDELIDKCVSELQQSFIE